MITTAYSLILQYLPIFTIISPTLFIGWLDGVEGKSESERESERNSWQLAQCCTRASAPGRQSGEAAKQFRFAPQAVGVASGLSAQFKLLFAEGQEIFLLELYFGTYFG